jgi:hypothetical protein
VTYVTRERTESVLTMRFACIASLSQTRNYPAIVILLLLDVLTLLGLLAGLVPPARHGDRHPQYDQRGNVMEERHARSGCAIEPRRLQKRMPNRIGIKSRFSPFTLKRM